MGFAVLVTVTAVLLLVEGEVVVGNEAVVVVAVAVDEAGQELGGCGELGCRFLGDGKSSISSHAAVELGCVVEKVVD